MESGTSGRSGAVGVRSGAGAHRREKSFPVTYRVGRGRLEGFGYRLAQVMQDLVRDQDLTVELLAILCVDAFERVPNLPRDMTNEVNIRLRGVQRLEHCVPGRDGFQRMREVSGEELLVEAGDRLGGGHWGRVCGGRAGASRGELQCAWPFVPLVRFAPPPPRPSLPSGPPAAAEPRPMRPWNLHRTSPSCCTVTNDLGLDVRLFANAEVAIDNAAFTELFDFLDVERAVRDINAEERAGRLTFFGNGAKGGVRRHRR